MPIFSYKSDYCFGFGSRFIILSLSSTVLNDGIPPSPPSPTRIEPRFELVFFFRQSWVGKKVRMFSNTAHVCVC